MREAGYQGRKRISAEVRHLVKVRGYPQKRAVAAALNQARMGKLGPSAKLAAKRYTPPKLATRPSTTTGRRAMPAPKRRWASAMARKRANRLASFGKYKPAATPSKKRKYQGFRSQEGTYHAFPVAMRKRATRPETGKGPMPITRARTNGKKRRRRRSTQLSLFGAPKRRRRTTRRPVSGVHRRRRHHYYYPRKGRPVRLRVIKGPRGGKGNILIRNPQGIVGTILHGITDGASIIVGKVIVRKVSGLIPIGQPAAGATPTTTQTLEQVLVQSALAVGAGFLADMAFGGRNDIARLVTAGGFVAPLESLLKLSNVQFITTALQGDGGMGVVGAYPMGAYDRRLDMGALPASMSANRGIPNLNQLVAPGSGITMAGYPALDTVATPGYGDDAGY